MRLVEVKKSATHRGHGVMFLQVSPQEALSLIVSLATQMGQRSPNTGRLETFLEDGRDFSIAVEAK